MDTSLLEELKAFDIYLEQVQQKINVTDLFQEDRCESFLRKQMVEIGAPNILVTASMLSKRYAYLVLSSTLYSMVEFNCVLYLHVTACGLSKERKLCVQGDLCTMQEVQNHDRDRWREDVLRNLFSSHLTPLI